MMVTEGGSVRRTMPWVAWLPRRSGRLAASAGLGLVAVGVLSQVVLLVVAPASHLVDVTRLVTAVAGAGLCLLRVALVAADRTAWAVLSVGLLAWTSVAVRWLNGGSGVGALPDHAGLLSLLFFIAGFGCLLLLAHARHAGPVPRGTAVSALVLILAAGAAASTTVGPRIHAATGGGVLAAGALVYVVLDVLLAAVLLAASSAAGRHERVWWALGAGFGCYLLTDAAYVIGSAAGDYAVSDGYGLGWSTGVGLLGVAAWSRPLAVRQLRLRPALWLGAPALGFAVALAVLVASSYGRPQPGAVPLAVTAIVLAAGRALLGVHRTFFVEAAEHEAVTDELTGLANRRLLLARLDELAGGSEPHALVLLDLNQFKEINDTLGHPVGDELLRRLGPRLAGTARQGETVARLGGDEFAVLLPGIGTEDAALRAAKRVLAGLLGAFVIDGLTLFVTASAGVALGPRHGSDGPTLLRCADVAMYQAKRSGGGAAVYRPLADPHSRSRLGAATELKRAIANGDIVCVYQPQVAVGTGVPVGAEALARWSDPKRGLVAPEEFLALAQHSGLMPALSEAVLRTALADAVRWREEVPELRVAVNLSAGSLLDSRLPERIAVALAATGMPAAALTLEIADGGMPDAGRARVVVERLHGMGVCVALDDYGTGRSSVVLLRQLPVGQLKLDGGLIDAVVADPRARAIARHTVRMAHDLDIHVVAKGVEDAATLAVVEQLGCDAAQGFLLASPMPAPDITRWLAARRAARAGTA